MILLKSGRDKSRKYLRGPRSAHEIGLLSTQSGPRKVAQLVIKAEAYYKAEAYPIRCSWVGFCELKIYRPKEGRQLPLLSQQSSIYWEIT
jgi:hypothetical protein